MKKSTQINIVLHEYFEHNKNVQKIPVSDMMPYFVLAGIFKKDDPQGNVIKTYLRKLDAKQELSTIPFALGIKVQVFKKWYFVRTNYQPPVEIAKKMVVNVEKIPFKLSDAFYVLNLCKKVLNSKLQIQKRVSLAHQKNVKIDGFFKDKKLFVNYINKQQSKVQKNRLSLENSHFEEENYQLIHISYKNFAHFTSGKLKRKSAEDLEIIRMLLEPFYTKTTLF